jgi:hypothetical protein
MGQTLIAEGLYRKAIDILKSSQNYNLALALNMYGRLISSDKKRLNEAENLLKESEKIIQSLPFWYNNLVKIKYLDFDFN